MPKRTPGGKHKVRLDKEYQVKQSKKARAKRQKKAAGRLFEFMAGS